MSKNIQLVYAHHDPNSFSKAMLDRDVKSLAKQGHEIRVSNLYAMVF